MKNLSFLLIPLFILSCSNDDSPQQEVCANPEISISDINLNDATVNINNLMSGNTFELEYGEEGYVLGSGTMVVVTEENFTISGLDNFKSYDVFARMTCSDSQSEWIGPLNFITQCSADNGIYNGDVTLLTQQEVDDFGAMCYSGINGILQIGNSLNNDINSLLPLMNINSVTTSQSSCTPQVRIFGTQLVSLKGLNLTMNLDCGLFVYENDLLINFQDVNLIDNLGFLAIRNNNSLESFLGLEELTHINSLIDIRNNNSLESFEGLNNLASWLYSNFEGNQNLHNFEGLDSLESVGDLWLSNTNFENFIGLETLTSINSISYFYNNDLLESFNGLENLTSSQNVKIYIGAEDVGGVGPAFGPNPNLSDYCGLQNLLNNSTGNVELFIANNLYNPTTQEIINGNCSQ